jgi:hypothetical protein
MENEAFPSLEKQEKSVQERLIDKAREKYGEIFPTATKSSFSQCFTSGADGKLIFWFNTADHSTHVVTENSL